eukprot:6578539-Pyramimonas_sp.AAC.2
MPLIYTEHPAVKSAEPGELAVPAAIYIGGVRYGGKAAAGRLKSTIALTLVNLVSGVRHVAATVRKQNFLQVRAQRLVLMS